MKSKLPITEELDFHYLLNLMPPLKGVPGFQWLPELFSTISEDSLVLLCQCAGGETIRIPTIDELNECIDALQCFYDVYIKHRITESEIPSELQPLVKKIQEVYNAGNTQTKD